MTRPRPENRLTRPWAGYALAVAATLAAAALRAAFYRAVGGGLPFLTFFPAVIVAALYGGRGPGLLATALSAVVAAYWIEPIGSPLVGRPTDQVGVALFVGVSLFIVWACDRVRQAGARAEAVAGANARLAAIVESTGDAVIGTAPDGTIRSWNAGAERLYGYPAAEAVGRPIDLVIPPDRAGEEAAILARLRAGERVEHYETVRVRKDGSRVDVSLTLSLVRDAAGGVVGASKIARDLTARRRAERAAEASLAQLQAVVGSMAEGVILADPRGNLLDWNDAALAMHGYRSLDEVRRQLPTFEDEIELRDAGGRTIPLSEWPMSRVLRGESFSGCELALRRRDTGRAWVISYSGRPIRDRDGHLTLALLTLHDVTEARRNQAELRDAAEWMRLAVGIAQMGTFVIDLGTDAVTVNEPGREIYGWPAGEPLTFAKVRTHFHPDDRDQVVRRIAAALDPAGPGQFEVEQRIVRTDGATRWIRVRGRALFDHGGGSGGGDGERRAPTRCVGTFLDVTEQKEAEARREHVLAAEREARDQAERTSRMKDEFLATLSHELRTPLNAIVGWAQILSRDPTGPDVAHGIEVIGRNARAQAQIIEDLLDMSRIISGKIRLDVQRLNLGDVVRAAVDTVQPGAEAKGVRVRAVLDPHAGPVSGDPNRLQQVFWNLLTNAVKFTPRGGRVQVVLERVNSHLEVGVTDTGEGIDPEFLPHVFDRFRQADASTTRRHGGLGLGLAIVKQLVELHGGSVRVKSAGPGLGSTFTVALPLTAIDPRAAEDGPDRRHPARGGAAPVLPDACQDIQGVRVLVVDDEPDARALVKRLLDDCKAVVATAGSAAEALARFEAAGPPDVLVADIGMPGEDGYSLIKRVRALGAERGGNVPAIALTAYARAEDRMKAILAGFQQHVVKPAEPAELITLISVLSGRQGGGG